MSQIRKFILEQVAEKNIDINYAKTLLKEINDSTSETAENSPIAIIGMAGKFPESESREEFWENLIAGKNCVSDFPPERRKDMDLMIADERIADKIGVRLANQTDDLSEMYKKGGYLKEIDKFDASFFNIPPKEAEAMNPYHRLFLECGYEAIEDAGYGGKTLNGSLTGVYVGRDHSIDTYYSDIKNDREMLTLIGSWTGILASRLSYFLDLRGPSVVFDTACSSTLVAIHNACSAIRNKECNMAIAGGITVGSGRIKVESGMHMVESENNEIRSFDRKANGTVWSEGLAAFLLKPLSKAIEDRDNIYAVIKGSAVNNDGFSNGITAPNAMAQKDLLLKAWENSGVAPDTISYIEAHGTGTNLGDPIEIKAIADAMRSHTNKKQFCGIGSVKSNLGHLQAASGAASLMKVILAIKNKKIPPTINFSEPNPFINFVESPVYINDKVREWDNCSMPRRAGVSAFAFNGTNCHVVLEEYTASRAEEPFTEEIGDNSPKVITLSAKDKSGVERLIKRYLEFLQEGSVPFENICYTANTGRGHYDYRLAVIAKNASILKEKLEYALSGLAENRERDIYAGQHRLVLKKSDSNASDQITESELRAFNYELNEILSSQVPSKESNIEILRRVCSLYVRGADVDWKEFYRGYKYKKESIPVYPYERRRFWPKMEESGERKNQSNDLFEVGWVEEERINKQLFSNGDILIFKNDNKSSRNIILHFRKQGYRVIEVEFGNDFASLGCDSFVIRNERADYEKLFNQKDIKDVKKIIHLLTLDGKEESVTLGELRESCNMGVHSAFRLIKEFSKARITKYSTVEMIFVSMNVNEVTGREKYLRPEFNSLFGLGKSVRYENGNLAIRCIDIDENTQTSELADEINIDMKNYMVCLRNGRRYIEEFRVSRQKKENLQKISLKEDNVYVITGGTGGIGLEAARYIASKKACTLVLVNRSKLPERWEWDSIIAANEEVELVGKLKKLKEIEELGSRVYCYSKDISDYDEAEELLTCIRREHGRINGLIHSAGVGGEGFLAEKDEETLNKVLSSKIYGTWILDRLTREDNLDFFMLFSSVITLFGGVSQSDYTSANSYLDAFAAYRNKRVPGTLTISWPTWSETGMAYDKLYYSRNAVFKSISTKEGVALLEKVMSGSRGRVIAGSFNYHFISPMKLQDLNFRVSDEIYEWIDKGNQKTGNSLAKKADADRITLKGRANDEYSEIEKSIAYIWHEVLGFDELDITCNFFELGGDSISVSKMQQMIDERFPNTVTITDIFSYPTICSQAEFIQNKLNQNQKKVKPLIMPGKYFVLHPENNRHAVFKFEIKDELYKRLLQTSEKKNIGVSEILLACFVNILGEAAESDYVSLQTMIKDKNTVEERSFDLSKADSAGLLLNMVHEVVMKAQPDMVYRIEESEKLSLDGQKNAAFPLFFISNLLSPSLLAMEKYDMALRVNEEEHGIFLEYEYNYKRMDNLEMKNLFGRYLKIIDFVSKQE